MIHLVSIAISHAMNDEATSVNDAAVKSVLAPASPAVDVLARSKGK